jgi:hypothetical protein
MATAHNGSPGPRPTRRLRFDEIELARGDGSGPESMDSGRRFVIVAGLTLLVLWGGLFLAFRDWRARYRARAAFGASQVAPVVDPMARVVPDGVDAAAWRRAVSETHAMLVTLTASNLLDLARMRALRGELAARVARARPETALGELAAVWNDMMDRAAPILKDRHPRPRLLPPQPEPPPARPRRAAGAASWR